MPSESGDNPEWFRFKTAVDHGNFRGQFDEWQGCTQAARDAMYEGRAAGDGKVLRWQDALRDKVDPIALTNERGKTHGDWMKQSKTFNQLMSVMERSHNWSTMEAHQKAALINIAQKMSRALTGDPFAADHWDDIAGYAHLGKGGHTS